MAFDQFNQQYRDRILNLVYAFPHDSFKKNDITGEQIPFWSGAKRFPQSVEFNPEEELNFEYIYTATNLFAFMLKIDPIRSKDEFKRFLYQANYHAPEWKPSSKFLNQVKSEVEAENATNPGENKPIVEEDDEAKIISIIEELRSYDTTHVGKLEPADFEKDDDTNFHIDFITACSNMRAWNYHISAATRHKCKMIAGRIIPAVATTTAMITGLVEIELYKLLLGLDKAKFLGANVNLGISTFRLFEPVSPKPAKERYDDIMMSTVKPCPPDFTIWDKVIVQHGDLTVKEFVDIFPEVHFGCTIDALFFKNLKKTDGEAEASPIWVSFPVTDTQREAKIRYEGMKLSDVYIEQIGPFPQGRKYIILDATVIGPDGQDASIPTLQFNFR